jgi:hypothetical protein
VNRRAVLSTLLLFLPSFSIKYEAKEKLTPTWAFALLHGMVSSCVTFSKSMTDDVVQSMAYGEKYMIGFKDTSDGFGLQQPI